MLDQAIATGSASPSFPHWSRALASRCLSEYERGAQRSNFEAARQRNRATGQLVCQRRL